MNQELSKKIEDAIWVSRSLFERGKTAGSSANISFRQENKIYISCSGSSFAKLEPEDFSVVRMEDDHLTVLSENKPSKELPLHWYLYRANPKIGAVLHTHSFYAVLWSCLKHKNETDIVPSYTPYLRMKVGTVGVVPYAAPGSKELFEYFEACVEKSDAYLLKNHGPVVGGTNVIDAFYKMEEIEESLKVAWYLKNLPQELINVI